MQVELREQHLPVEEVKSKIIPDVKKRPGNIGRFLVSGN
jgi:hypothetical protein